MVDILSIFSYLADFFGGLGALASQVTVSEFLSFLNNGSELVIPYTNIFTGSLSNYTINNSLLIGLLTPIINIFSFVLPEFVYSMPLFYGLLLGSIEWFIFVSLFKFFRNVF